MLLVELGLYIFIWLLNKTVMLIWQLENYQKELEEMNNMSRQEYVAHLRR